MDHSEDIMKALALLLVLGAALAAFDDQPAVPCCAITGIDATTGMVTAVHNATGRSFQFQVAEAAVLQGLEVGQSIDANFTKQVAITHVVLTAPMANVSQPNRHSVR